MHLAAIARDAALLTEFTACASMGVITPMAKIYAGINELKAAHLRLNSTARTNQGPPSHLLLFYAAECGLKYAHLKRRSLRTTEQLGDVDHDLNALIKSLNV